jgi:hypothetical protein
MADLESNFQLLYVKAKSLSDSKDISLARDACNELIKVAADDAQLLDKAFTIYRYIYSRSFPNSAPYSWFEKGVLVDFPNLTTHNPKTAKISSQTSVTPDENDGVWERVKFIAKLARTKDADHIATYISQRQINSVLHFSHASNLKSIIQHGILGRNSLAEKGIDFFRTDEKRLDLLPDAISLSVTRPNLLMLSSKSMSLRTDEWVVFDISPNILTTHDFAAFPSNAAATEITSALKIDPLKFCGLRGLEQLFVDGKSSTRASTVTGTKILREPLGIPTNVTTDSQAELMILNEIDASHINRIMISTSASAKQSELLDEIKLSNPSITIQRDFHLLDSPIDTTGLKERTISWNSIDQAMRDDFG